MIRIAPLFVNMSSVNELCESMGITPKAALSIIVTGIAALAAVASTIIAIVSVRQTKKIINDSQRPKLDILFVPLGGYLADVYIRNISKNIAQNITFKVECTKKKSKLFISLRKSLKDLRISQMVGDERYMMLCSYDSNDVHKGKPVKITMTFTDESNNLLSYVHNLDLSTTEDRIIADHSGLHADLKKISDKLGSIDTSLRYK